MFKRLTYFSFVACLLSGYAVSLENVAGIQMQLLAHSTQSWDGTILPSYPSGQPEIKILKITIPPFTKLPMHQHPVMNAGVLLKGKLTVVKENNEQLDIQAGDALIELVNTWHYGINKHDTPAEIIVFYASSKGSDITIKR